ncbi:MAG TPA: hypothetical protein VGW38_00415 [Chloroflexota bacterium]|nr:hypothetical protein [Chloroflexota bacterium]
MFASLMLVLFVIAPVVGFAAIAILLLFHEYGEVGLAAAPSPKARVPRVLTEPVVACRSNTSLLNEYLVDDREASTLERLRENARLVVRLERAQTAVLEEYLVECSGGLQPVAARVSNPEQTAPPIFEPAARRAPAPVYERAARPTRLMPLSPEMAVG